MKPIITVRLRLLLLVSYIIIITNQSSAQTETFSTGSFIINMGATNPNTIANGLKPYGLIYDLLKNYKTPVKWVIGAGKVKDGVDFTYLGVPYKGGTFIIPAEFRNATVNGRITFWTGQGVVGVTTTSPLTVNVTQTFITAPRWTLDADNGDIAEDYLINAGITNVGFSLGAYNWKSVQTLNVCDDFFVMPHADPTWATHSNLFTWNQTALGSIWASCHAVSALENSINPANTTQQMNFLSTRTAVVTPTPWPNNSLKLWGSHSKGSVPFTHLLYDDPIAQYLGTTDLAHLSGSEQIYIPKQAGDPGGATRWNPGIKIIAYDPTQVNVSAPNLAAGNVAALIVYGRGKDDPNRGYVMYEAGHSHNKGTTSDVAVQRAFFNFSFFQAQFKVPQLTVSGVVSGQVISNSGGTVAVSVVATSPLSGVTFTYLWSSSCGGTFASPTSASTTFNPSAATPGNCVLTCEVTDNCGRRSFKSFPVVITVGPQPPVANTDNASVSVTCGAGTPVVVNVLANDTDPTGLPLTLTNVTGAVNGTVSFTAAGNVTFTPNANFTGPLALTYTVCNTAPLCTNGTFNITLSGASTPAAVADAFTIAEDAIGTFNVLANDAGGLTVSAITSGPANGKVSINTDNTITYVPNADFAGTDNFTYKVVSASSGTNTAVVTVTVTNDACDAGTLPITPTIAPKLTLNPTADTYIDENLIGTNYGTAVTLGTNRNGGKVQRTLMNFNVSTIPSTSKIRYARLYLNQITSRTDIIAAYRANAAWTETGATWTNMNSNFVGTTAYPAGGITPVIGWNSLDVTSLVQSWVDGTFTNQGLMVKVVTESGGAAIATYDSKETATPSLKPYLEIYYATNAGGIASANLIDTADTYVDQNVPTSNFGSTNPLITDKNGGKVKRALFKFNMSTLPANIAIADGQVNLNQVSNNIDIQAIHRVTGAWNESAVTFNTIPAFDATPLPAAGFTPVQGLNIIDIGSLPQQWYDGTYTNLGVMLKLVTETGGSNNHTWSSREDATSTKRPYLSVAYFTTGCQAIPTRAPLAMPDTANTPNGVAVNISTATNDFYPVAGARTYTIETTPASGTATINATTGVITYTPTTTFNGVRSFTYRVTHDATTLFDIATVYVNITNGPIVANNDVPAGALSGTVQTVNVRANDTDPEIASLNNTYPVTIVTPPVNGTATVDGSGNIVYTPNAGFTGTDVVTYRICEPTPTCGSSLCATATVTFTVQNRVPTATNDSRTTLPCLAVTINLTANDTDPENGVLTVTNISVLSNPAAGTVVNNNDGTVTFTPATGFIGTVTFTYTVTDNGVAPLVSAPATVTITVSAPVNTAPVAVDDVETMNMNGINFASVLDNDSDPENNALTIPTITVPPVNGTAIVLANGLIEYTPNPGYTGTDVLTYRICDILNNPETCINDTSLCDLATLTITVLPIPDSDNKFHLISEPTVGQFITLNGGSNPPILSGSDPTDCVSGCILSTRSVVIQAVPANAELYYNGILVSVGQLIANFNPALLQFKITANTIGTTSISFQYSFLNSVGNIDLSPATYTLNWRDPLPVTGLLATVSLNGNTAIIKWLTLSEQNTDYFVLQRSLDNINYVAIGNTVQAAKNSTTKMDYQQPDNISSLPQTSVIYYRVKLIDIDGKFKYSNVAALKISQKPGITVWPNPFRSSITVSITTEKETTVGINLIDVSGRVIRKTTQSADKGITRIVVGNLEQLPAGVYLVEITDKKTGTTYQKLLMNDK